MKLSKQTLELLKNFSTINQNLYVKPGSKLATMSVAKNIVATVEVDEVFEQEFGVYNLNELIGIMSLFEDPEIVFGEKSLSIKQGRNSVTYYYAQKEVLVTPEKDLKLPSVDVSFELKKEQLDSLRKSAGVLGATDLSFVGDGEKIKAIVGDVKNATANTMSIEVGETDKTFNMFFKVENLKMIPQDFVVEISAKGISKFTNSALDYTMFVALEKNSTFG